jgi:hypothetical protein
VSGALSPHPRARRAHPHTRASLPTTPPLTLADSAPPPCALHPPPSPLCGRSPSYGGGSDLWDELRGAPLSSTLRFLKEWGKETSPASMADGKLEVVGVTSVVHLALSLGGFSNGVRLCQGRDVQITALDSGVPLQIDGEPFNQDGGDAPFTSKTCEPFSLAIEHQGHALMLARGGSGPSAYAAVENQLSQEAISTAQRDALLEALGRPD